MKPQVVAWELGKTPIVRRHRLSRFRNYRNLVGAADSCQARADVFAVGNSRHAWPTACPIPSPRKSPIRTGSASAFVGDGGFSMLMAEFATCVKYRLPVKVIVIKNNTLGMIKWEQMVFLGNPEYGCELQPIDFAAFAQACGGTGFTIEDPASCGAILDHALALPGPVIIEAVVDPFVPPMPPKITFDQAVNLPNPWRGANPTERKSPGPFFRTKCES